MSVFRLVFESGLILVVYYIGIFTGFFSDFGTEGGEAVVRVKRYPLGRKNSRRE